MQTRQDNKHNPHQAMKTVDYAYNLRNRRNTFQKCNNLDDETRKFRLDCQFA